MASYVSRALLASLLAKTVAAYALGLNLTTFTGNPDGSCSGIGANNCSADGFRVTYYANPIGGNSPANTKPWNYTITEALRPLDSALTLSTVFAQNYEPSSHSKKVNGNAYWTGWTRITSGNISVDANSFTLVYSGFYRAPETGTYTFCAVADNQNDLFFGHGNAFDCSNGNVNTTVSPVLTALDTNYSTNATCVDIDMNEGGYYPIRSVMKNWQGPSAFNLTIKRPTESDLQTTNFFEGLAYPIDCGMYD